MEENRILWQWKNGDMIFIDNRQVMHSRNTFTGERKVYSLWGRPLDEKIEPDMVPCFGEYNKVLPLAFGLWKIPKESAKQVTYNAIVNGFED